MENKQLDDVTDINVGESLWVSVKGNLPTDTALLAVLKSDGKYVIRRGRHFNQFEIEAGSEEENYSFNHADGICYIPEGWYEEIGNWDDYSPVRIHEGTVTHWMSLPLTPDGGVSE